MDWSHLINLALPVVSYIVAFFVHKPKSPKKESK